MTTSTARREQRDASGTPVSADSPRIPLRVAVVVASRHGSTTGIAEAIRAQLSNAGLRARLFVADDFHSFEGADAVVLGSALYAGRWLNAAQELIDRHRTELSKVPVWIFSSGPVGDPPTPTAETPEPVLRAAEAVGARDTRVFSGRLDHDLLGLGERTLMKAMRAPQGDFRDWSAIGDWADGIAAELTGSELPADADGPYIHALSAA
ncbi:MAG: flavodoxin domain-containing protein [Thermoleophilaceae bacterium]|nr:flavodoxin domain-containing protein [Thermoleophilaceae bacterium]